MRQLVICLLMLSAGVARAEFSHSYIDQHQLHVVPVNAIEIAYRDIGRQEDPVVLMIMGLGASHRVHGDKLVKGIETAGYRVIIFDNRDVGDSTRFDHWGQPTVWWQLLKDKVGLAVDAPFTLDEMAADGAGLLDFLDISKAHVVGFSMGGMIAQQMAVNHPQRVASLISVMSTTGAKHLPPPTKEATQALTNLASGSAAEGRDKMMRERGFYPESMPRQMMAIFRAGDRSSDVSTISAKTLVIHGEDDGLIPPAHGQHTADTIKDADLVVYPGMAHNVPEDILPKMIERMVSHMSKNYSGSVTQFNGG